MLLGNGSEVNIYRTALTRELPVNRNGESVLTLQQYRDVRGFVCSGVRSVLTLQPYRDVTGVCLFRSQICAYSATVPRC
jgi:hypothetical protein